MSSQILDSQTGLSRISFADIRPAKDFDEMDFQFFNPRILDANNRENYGFSEEEIENLKKSIKSKGLMESFHVNLIDNEYVLIDGHRRHEAIRQLIEENAQCYDRITNQYLYAKDIYTNILVNVHHNLNPSECFSRAFESDSNKVSFGENASIRFIDYCVSFHMNENNILKMCGKSITWLKNTIKLLQKVNKDREIKSALLDGRINASAASSLMEIDNEEERKEIFQKALEKAKEDYNQKIEQQDKNINNTKKKIKKAEKMKVDAENLGDLEDADALIEKHASTLEERKRERSDLSPRINSKNLEDAIDDIDSSEIDDKSEDETPAPKTKQPKLSMKSIRDSWTKDIAASIARDHMTDEHEAITPILNNCFADMIKAMFDEKISYQDFIYRWSTRFAEAGLPDNAGSNVDSNDEVE
jgi:hypothetical protein